MNENRNFDWDLARTFLSVLDSGSLSAAAKELNSSQPTVGRQITAIEEQLGVTLFNRTGRELIPTPAAFDVADQARAMQAAAAKLTMAATGHSETLEGTVRITASEVMATYTLPKILTKLLLEEPGLEIELVASNSTENLLLREADIAIRMHRPEQADLIARKIGDLPLGIFAHRDYLKRAGTPTSMEELGQHIFLGYDKSDLMINGIRAFGAEVDRHDFRLRTDDQVAYVEAIVAGAGLGATSVISIGDRDGIVRLMEDLKIPPMPMWIAAHQELKTSALVRRVFDRLADELTAVCAQQTSKHRSVRQ